MTQLVDFRIHHKRNILDLVITNCSERIINVADTGKLRNSAHCSLLVEMSVQVKTEIKSINKPDWNRADFKANKADLSNVNWPIMLTGTAEQDCQYFKEQIQNVWRNMFH
jgi:hypothetical protein